ncbi:MAG: hypothetical protein SFY80_16965 [Verrucomicrobiota bacterium]|nr:hypothetical protein [Verrucomicrobiota bacterium]
MSRFRQSLEQALASSRKGEGFLTEWPKETVPEILRLLWQAYDRLKQTALCQIDIQQADLQLERSICALLSDEIQMLLRESGGFASYLVSHERWEMETLNPEVSNRPSQYDICFVWYAQRELKWPCEAKVLKTDGDVLPYVADIRNEFIPCTYGPLSSSGAMLGLLVQGDCHAALRNIALKLKLPVTASLEHSNRPHACTTLSRTSPPAKTYPTVFELHHLILHLRPQ